MTPRLAALDVSVLLLAVGSAHPSGQSPVLQAAMREKLSNTQGLPEAVVRADFASVSKYTDRLSRISEKEIALWQTALDPVSWTPFERWIRWDAWDQAEVVGESGGSSLTSSRQGRFAWSWMKARRSGPSPASWT
jgi:hypothetical protein